MRVLLAFVLGLTLVVGSLLPQLPAPFSIEPGAVLAADATVSACTEAGFDEALTDVQTSGGGTITFDCGGTITFTGEKTITSNVTIIGNGNVVFDGNDSTRLFRVNTGATLELVEVTLQHGRAIDGNSAASGGAI